MDQVVKLVASVKTAVLSVLELIGFEPNNGEKAQVKTRHDPELVKHLDSCPDDQRFTKLKYTTVSTTDHRYSEYYEEGVIEDRILTEFILQMNSPKSSSKRNTTQFLDFLGSIGGIQKSLSTLFVMLGGFFSAKFQLLSIAQTLYVRKKNKRELRRRAQT